MFFWKCIFFHIGVCVIFPFETDAVEPNNAKEQVGGSILKIKEQWKIHEKGARKGVTRADDPIQPNPTKQNQWPDAHWG